ncbi:ATP-binding protein [Salmonella enterica]|nr:ATP-binding protein [Salmonella enterica]HEC8456411.1 ATP-binding protein [Salmonella enterica subsp. enterica serovar Poona]
MALKIVKASQPIEVKNLIACIYAPPGLGKTSMAFTSDKPLLLDFDKGAYRSQFRKDSVQINSWNDIEQITESDLVPYNTIVIDTAGRALDCMAANLISNNPKFKGFGGQLSLQGFGALKAGFSAWLNLLRSFGKDIILIAHMEEKQIGEDLVERLDIQGSSKGEIYKVADVMGRIRIEGAGNTAKRVLDFNPSSSGFGKNPAQLPVMTIPHYDSDPDFMAEVLTGIKEELNKQSEEVRKAKEEIDHLRTNFESLETEQDFNDAVIQFKEAPADHKRVLNEVAKRKGFQFDKKSGTYIKVAA